MESIRSHWFHPLRGYGGYLLILTLLSMTAAYCSLMVTAQIEHLIDGIQEPTWQRTLWWFVAYKFFFHGMFFLMRLADIRYMPRLLQDTISSIYQHVMGHSLHWFEEKLSGDIAAKIADYQDGTAALIYQYARALFSLMNILLSLYFLWNMNHQPFWVLLDFVLIYSPIIFVLLKKQLQPQQSLHLSKQHTMELLNDSTMNIFSLKIIGNWVKEFHSHILPALNQWRSWDKYTRSFDAYWVVYSLALTLHCLRFNRRIFLLMNPIDSRIDGTLAPSASCHRHFAHRFSTLKSMDRIVVLDKGRIIQSETHDELLIQTQGLYHRLWNMQQSHS